MIIISYFRTLLLQPFSSKNKAISYKHNKHLDLTKTTVCIHKENKVLMLTELYLTIEFNLIFQLWMNSHGLDTLFLTN